MYRIYLLLLSGIGLGLALSSTRRAQIEKDQALRDHLTERQVDKMIADSFPASDPPSTY